MKYNHFSQIGDFGLAIYEGEIKYAFTKCGTPGFIAPEIFLIQKGKALYDKNCDYFSLGIAFYFIRFGKLPYMAENNEELMEKNKLCYFTFPGNEKFMSLDSKGSFALNILKKLKLGLKYWDLILNKS